MENEWQVYLELDADVSAWCANFLKESIPCFSREAPPVFRRGRWTKARNSLTIMGMFFNLHKSYPAAYIKHCSNKGQAPPLEDHDMLLILADDPTKSFDHACLDRDTGKGGGGKTRHGREPSQAAKQPFHRLGIFYHQTLV